MPQIATGTVNLTNNSATVIAEGGSDWNDVVAGDWFTRAGSFAIYTVAAQATLVSGAWRFNLTAPYAGITESSAPYVIHQEFDANGLAIFRAGDTELQAILNRNFQIMSTLPGGGGGGSGGELVTKEIWVGRWLSSATVGAGTQASPHNAYTRAQFDAIMGGLSSSYKWIVNLLDGSYDTHGNLVWSVRSAMQLVAPGGPQSTIIKMATSVIAGLPGGYTIWPVGTDYNIQNTGCLVEGITVDGNWPALLAAGEIATRAIGGIALQGDNHIIRNCISKNSHGHFAAGNESFPLIIAAKLGGGSCRHNLIESCEVNSIYGDYTSAVGIAGFYSIDGNIRDCIVRGSYAPQANPILQSAFFTDGGVVSNCTSIGVSAGFRAEQAKDFTVKDCKFFDCWQFGIELLMAGSEPVIDGVLSCNIIEMRDDDHHTGIHAISGVSNLTIIGNKVRHKVTGNPPRSGAAPYGIRVAGAGMIVANNQVTPDFPYNNSAPADAYIMGNRTPDGKPLLGLPDHTRHSTENSATVGALEISADLGANGAVALTLAVTPSYVIVAGDKLELEMFAHPANPVCKMDIWIRFNDGDFTPDTPDHNGFPLIPCPDLSSYARGRWYRRSMLLSAYAGETVESLRMQIASVAAATHRYFVRNARISNAAGVQKVSFWTDYDSVPAVSIFTNTNATNVKVGPVSPQSLLLPSSGAMRLPTLPEHADNAAALAAGLTAGTPYRTVDTVKITR